MLKTDKSDYRTEIWINKKGDKLYVKWKSHDSPFNDWIHKKISLYKMSYFPEPYSHSKNNVNFIWIKQKQKRNRTKFV